METEITDGPPARGANATRRMPGDVLRVAAGGGIQRTGCAPDPAARLRHPLAGRMFWFRWKTLSGSQAAFTWARRS
jgi:hypothetical protein